VNIYLTEGNGYNTLMTGREVMKARTGFVIYFILVVSIAIFMNYGKPIVVNKTVKFEEQWTNPKLISEIAVSDFVNTQAEKPSNHSLQDYKLVAHALGGIKYKRATNSLAAMKFNYTQNSLKLFEADLILSSDHVLVARHDWLPYLYDLLEQDVPDDKKLSPLTFEEFMGMKVNNEFYPLDFQTLAVILKNHPDIFLITDTKSTNPEEYRIQYNLIVKIAKEIDESILDRIVIEVYNEEMYEEVIKIYPFKNIFYALYMNTDSENKIINFCNTNHIEYIAIPRERVTQEFIKKLLDQNIKTFVHTVNDAGEVKELKAMGVWGIFSDFLIDY
jgi:glycerophosphoryl diester phosphodiesterase